MHEIITLQLGQRSNYLATHFWNTQESYFTYSTDQEPLVDHDIHFRPGLGVDGTETFTPRTVIYDLKGGFGTLRKINALYELQEEGFTTQGLWNGPTVIQRQASIERNVYQQSLEEGLVPPELTKKSVRYWSDFNRVYFHPKSIVQLNEYELGSSIMPFEKWSIGEELFGTLDKEHDMLDRDLRPFVEEADQMQAIQLMSSVDDAWGGFAARYMDRLRDEYGKTTIWVWGLEEGLKSTPSDKQFLRLSNTARSISEISSLASQFMPIAVPSNNLPPYVSIDRQSMWHVSALMSTALESMTLPSRLKSPRQTLDEITGVLNVNGNQNIARLQMSIIGSESPGPLHMNRADRPEKLGARGQHGDLRVPSQNGLDDGRETAQDSPEDMDMDFLPSDQPNQARGHRVTKKVHTFGEVNSFRGEEDPSGIDVDGTRPDGRERAQRRAAGLKILHKTRTPLLFSLLDSFPHIYSHPLASLSSRSVSVQTSLSTDTSVAWRMKTLQNIVSRSVGLDEREALSNSLGVMAESYEEGWDSGSDEDDD